MSRTVEKAGKEDWVGTPARARSLLGGTKGGHERTTTKDGRGSVHFVSICGSNLHQVWVKFSVRIIQTDKMEHCV